ALKPIAVLSKPVLPGRAPIPKLVFSLGAANALECTSSSATATASVEVIVLSWIDWFMVLLSFSPLRRFWNCGSGRDEEPSGKCPPPDSNPYSDAKLGKNLVS